MLPGRRWIVAALLVLISLPVAAKNGGAAPKAPKPAPVIDDPDTANAKRHFRAGAEFYNSGKYEEALEEFRLANRARPAPDFVYNIARCYDRLEKYREALEQYQIYVKENPGDKVSLDEAKRRIAALEQKLDKLDPRADDGRKNGDETDADCGGAKAPKCIAGKSCLKPADCASDVCQDGRCAASPKDGLKNGSETDVDCGGGGAPACATGKACNAGSDCKSTLCTDGKCEAPLCENARKDARESDVDCGGGCKGCALEKTCRTDGDCESGSCGKKGLCQTPWHKRPVVWGVIGGVVVLGAVGAGVGAALYDPNAPHGPGAIPINW